MWPIFPQRNDSVWLRRSFHRRDKFPPIVGSSLTIRLPAQTGRLGHLRVDAVALRSVTIPTSRPLGCCVFLKTQDQPVRHTDHAGARLRRIGDVLGRVFHDLRAK
jgi:hypothetical protein